MLGAVPDVEMTTPEVKCAFVRYVDGVDLGKLPETQRILFRKEVARDWVLRLVMGDYDGHGLNFKVGANGRVFPYDRNLADVLCENRTTLLRVLGKAELAADPVLLRQDLMKLMRWRLDVMMGTDAMSRNAPLYHQLDRAHQHMTYEDFQDTIRIMQGWDEAFIKAQLGDAFGNRAGEAAKLIKARIDCLEALLSDPKLFPKLPGAPTPSTVLLPRLQHTAPNLAKAA